MKPSLEKKRIAMHGKLARFNCRSQTSYATFTNVCVYALYALLLHRLRSGQQARTVVKRLRTIYMYFVSGRSLSWSALDVCSVQRRRYINLPDFSIIFNFIIKFINFGSKFGEILLAIICSRRKLKNSMIYNVYETVKQLKILIKFYY